MAPAHAPLAAAQAPVPAQRPAVDRRATVVDGVLQLQGPRLWPFNAAQRIALKSALIAAMPGVVADSIRIVDTEQACPSATWSSSLFCDFTNGIPA